MHRFDLACCDDRCRDRLVMAPSVDRIVISRFRSKLRFVWTAPTGFVARRLWLAFTALSAFSVARTLWSRFWKKKKDAFTPLTIESHRRQRIQLLHQLSILPGRTYSKMSSMEDVVRLEDLKHLIHLLDGDMAWQSMMDLSTSNLAYQAWHHEPETGPTIFWSRPVFEDATPEQVRDFYWDDEFRSNGILCLHASIYYKNALIHEL